MAREDTPHGPLPLLLLLLPAPPMHARLLAQLRAAAAMAGGRPLSERSSKGDETVAPPRETRRSAVGASRIMLTRGRPSSDGVFRARAAAPE